MRLETTSDCARLDAKDLLEFYKVNPETGLDNSEIRLRTNLYGLNILESKPEESLFVKFFKGVFMNPMVLLLLGSSVISILVGNYDDAFSITLAILIVSTVGFVQEYRSEQTLKALSELVPHFCTVLRDSNQTTINVTNLVPGDIVSFMTGDRIPADIRLITSSHLEIDESNLTGESESRYKTSQDYTPSLNSANDSSFSEQQNIAFMGTLVRNGAGSGVVCFTGSKTEFGRIHSMLQEIEEPRTPLQNSMDTLGAQLSMVSFAVIAVIMLVGLIQGLGWMNMFTISVSLAVAAIPEGLSIVVTVTLAVGVFKMAKRKAICKKLPSVETLGSTSVICVDKTGTLTLNKMEVQYLYTITDGLISLSPDNISQASSSWSYNQLLKSGNLCNNAKIDDKNELIGQATDIAMLNAALRVRGVDERERYNRISEIPFNSEVKKMSTTYPSFVEQEYYQSISSSLNPGSLNQTVLYVKGALEHIIDSCTTHYSHLGRISTLDDSLRQEVLAQAENLSHRGLRVVATALGVDEHNLSFIGFEVMKDPPRPDVDITISRLIKAGVRIVMITGDSEDTALAIASSVGIPSASGSSSCMNGNQLEKISDAELAQVIGGISVFARSTPKHKVKIVRALQSIGEVVGMMGDGGKAKNKIPLLSF
ncbi:Calcium-transporting ATPase 1 [Smittium mucronatum]|uniref:Calcium-transporting ATPase 1 n=1 Tax=Smittium mucronatum TaxID=133383 RepID=A0A1R0GPA0_9FUNG|nr:Calcium-transporting ATPase 1 [Smittium mucronatum]